jgi:HAD superfamily hydrolase (TIGR01509 family)
MIFLRRLHDQGVAAARDGLRGKPTPDTYLAAAQALHVSPSQAAVFEDAPAGVENGVDVRRTA